MGKSISRITPGVVWYSPPRVFWEFEQLDPAELQTNNGLNQHVEDIRVTSVVALLMRKLYGDPNYFAFVRLCRPDPPDAEIALTTFPPGDTLLKSKIEVTTYTGDPKETLLSRLQRKKIRPGIKILSSNYVLVVNLGIDFNIDQELPLIKKYTDEQQTDFPIWIVQEKQAKPETIAEITIIDDQVRRTQINVGELAHEYNEKRITGVFETGRVGSQNSVRFEQTDKKYPSPWETMKE